MTELLNGQIVAALSGWQIVSAAAIAFAAGYVVRQVWRRV
jgi:hypothetical protein